MYTQPLEFPTHSVLAGYEQRHTPFDGHPSGFLSCTLASGLLRGIHIVGLSPGILASGFLTG
ncbi:hypothetical protein GCM10027562_28970 [Arthrobacter pigmenti]